jgi:hypothetical protein
MCLVFDSGGEDEGDAATLRLPIIRPPWYNLSRRVLPAVEEEEKRFYGACFAPWQAGFWSLTSRCADPHRCSTTRR